jgi:hypothetical protein
MPQPAATFTVARTPAFVNLLKDYEKHGHRKLDADIAWLEDKLKLSPEALGERVPQLQNLALPIFKTRCKDSCHNIGSSGGWRIYYAINKDERKVLLLFRIGVEATRRGIAVRRKCATSSGSVTSPNEMI